MAGQTALPKTMEQCKNEPMEISMPTLQEAMTEKTCQPVIIFEDEPSPPSGSGVLGSEVSNHMLSALLKKPLKKLKMCTSSDCVTPGRENAILRRVGGLMIGSPHSPRFEGFKRPMEDPSSPVDAKRTKAGTMDKIMEPLIRHDHNIECTPPHKKTRNEMEDICHAAKHDAAKKLPALKFMPDTPRPSGSFNRAFSESHINIMKAVEGFGNNPDLIGDGSKCYSLPMLPGKHSDLKEISGETMAALLRGGFTDKIAGFEIVDCRYPYEYNAGHIESAVNIHTQSQLFDRYLDGKGPIVPGVATKPGFVLIFHCEYSSQRGPDMCRFLRDADRNVNMISYPSIYYPEVYILAGGYKKFYETHREHCTPQKYTSMFDPKHAPEMRYFRSQSKSSLVKTKSSSSEPIELNRKKSACFKKLEL